MNIGKHWTGNTQNWTEHKKHLEEYYDEEDGINSIGYAFDLRDNDGDYYYYLLLSGGGETSGIAFHVDENLFLNDITYEFTKDGRTHVIGIAQDIFANNLWDELDLSGVVDSKWEERFDI